MSFGYDRGRRVGSGQYIKWTYPIYPNMSPHDMECKCNSRIRSEFSLLSLEGNSLNIEIEGAEGAKQENPETSG